MNFSGKTVLVTGGSRGIGRAVAIGFAARGARVAVNYLSNSDAADETIAAMDGGPHLAVQGDVSDPSAVQRLFDDVIGAFGGIDIVVNNAGIYRYHRLEDVDYDQWQSAWREVLDTNLVGPANVCYCAARHMIERGGGRIVNVSSRGAFRGEPEGPAYGASKAGLNAMSQSLAQRLAPHNIFVGVVAPGPRGQDPRHPEGGRDPGPEPARPGRNARGGGLRRPLPGLRWRRVLDRNHHRCKWGVVLAELMLNVQFSILNFEFPLTPPANRGRAGGH